MWNNEQLQAGDGGGCHAGWTNRLAAWVIGADADKRAEIALIARAAGFAIEQSLPVDAALDLVGQHEHPAAVFAELAEPFDDAQRMLVELLDMTAPDARRSVFVGFPRSLIDQVATCVAGPHLTLLCEPSTAERIAGIEVARLAPGKNVFAGDAVTEAMKLQRLADEVARIARALAGLADPDAEPRVEAVSDGLIGYRAGPATPSGATGKPLAIKADDVRTMIRLRRQREAMFRGELFADPAWDMMLDLMAARIERLKVSVSSLCIAASVPPTTALRWIRTLTDIGIFVRVADPNDRRRVFIELSDAAATQVLNFLGEAKRAGVAIV